MIYRVMSLVGVVFVSLGTSLDGGLGLALIFVGGVTVGFIGGQADHYRNSR